MPDTSTNRLDDLARLLADLAVAGRYPPTFVAARGLAAPDGGELVFATLDDPRPPLAVLDLDPDPSWDAVGLLGTGTAHAMPGARSVHRGACR